MGHVPNLPLPLLGRWSIVAQKAPWSPGPLSSERTPWLYWTRLLGAELLPPTSTLPHSFLPAPEGVSKTANWILSLFQLKQTSIALRTEIKILQRLLKPTCPHAPLMASRPRAPSSSSTGPLLVPSEHMLQFVELANRPASDPLDCKLHEKEAWSFASLPLCSQRLTQCQTQDPTQGRRSTHTY